MTNSGIVDIHIGPYDYMNDIRVNLWLSCDVSFASWYFTKPGMNLYPPKSSHAQYIVTLITGFVLLFCCSVPASP